MHGKKEPKSEIYKKKPKNGIYTPDGFHPSLPASEVDSRCAQNLEVFLGVFVLRYSRPCFLCFRELCPAKMSCSFSSPSSGRNDANSSNNIFINDRIMKSWLWWHDWSFFGTSVSMSSEVWEIPDLCFNVIWSKRRGVVRNTWFTSRHRSWKASATWARVGQVVISGNTIKPSVGTI